MARNRQSAKAAKWQPQSAHDWIRNGYKDAPTAWGWFPLSDKQLARVSRANPALLYHGQIPSTIQNEGTPLSADPSDATLYWLSKDMLPMPNIAWEAATTTEIETILAETLLPATHGIMLFETQEWFPLQTENDREPLGCHNATAPMTAGVEWLRINGYTYYRMLARTYQSRTRGVVLPLVDGITAAFETTLLGKIHRVWELSVISANLMMTPTVTERMTVKAEGATRVASRRAHVPVPNVKVINLRPMRYVREDSDSSGRKYKHRWVVNGHWRNQAHGKGYKKRKRVWVNPYLKGPEGAPLLNQKKVYVWNR